MVNLRSHFTSDFLDNSPIYLLESALSRRKKITAESAAVDNALQQHITQRMQKEFKVSSPEEIADAVFSLVEVLNKITPRDEHRASFHGFSVNNLAGIRVKVSNGPSSIRCPVEGNLLDYSNLLLVTMYLSGHSDHYVLHATEEEHEKRMNALTEKFGVLTEDFWNGGEGNSGISVVLRVPCPASLKNAIDNDLKQVAGLGYDKFCNDVAAALSS